jgi:hypothetical protein
MWPISKTKGSSKASGERQPLLRPVDEEASVQQTVTPLPKLQFSILLFLQMMEPTNNQVIYPFINQVTCSFWTLFLAVHIDFFLFSSYVSWVSLAATQEKLDIMLVCVAFFFFQTIVLMCFVGLIVRYITLL